MTRLFRRTRITGVGTPPPPTAPVLAGISPSTAPIGAIAGAVLTLGVIR